MKSNQPARFWPSAAQGLLGSLGLALLTFVCFRFRVQSTTVALLYLIVIVLVSLKGNLTPAAFVSIIAYFCLDFFFTSPLFHLAMNQPLDIVAPIAFLTTAIVITRLITQVRASEETLRKAQAELAHISRVMTMGELAASIAHEINQPLAAIANNGSACLRWLAGDSPNLEEARKTAQHIIRDGQRAGEVIARIRSLLRKTEAKKTRLDINQTIQEIITLTRNEATRKSVTLRLELAPDLPPVWGDRVQLQQVMLNLVMNGIESMAAKTGPPPELLIYSKRYETDQILVAVQDFGVGLGSQNIEEIFNAFFTTKAQGLGMGLAISRSIVEDHGGRLWVTPNEGAGATFQFTLLQYQKSGENAYV